MQQELGLAIPLAKVAQQPTRTEAVYGAVHTPLLPRRENKKASPLPPLPPFPPGPGHRAAKGQLVSHRACLAASSAFPQELRLIIDTISGVGWPFSNSLPTLTRRGVGGSPFLQEFRHEHALVEIEGLFLS